MRHGVTYKDKNTGEETHVEWWTTGCYHSCLNWEEKTQVRDVRRMGNHTSGTCHELHPTTI